MKNDNILLTEVSTFLILRLTISELTQSIIFSELKLYFWLLLLIFKTLSLIFKTIKTYNAIKYYQDHIQTQSWIMYFF